MSSPPPPHKPSNLEKNCTQIFSKGPALTRGILEKVRKNKTRIMGHEVETKQFLLLSGMVFLFLLSLSGTIAMWFTDAFDNAVFSNLAIVEGSQAYEMWAKPSPKPLLKVTIFNYTNVQEFANGQEKKLNVKEMGPYIYEIAMERIKAKFNKDKVSYEEQRVYKFMPELSKGHKQNDKVTVPNVPLFTAASINKHASFLTRVGLSGLLNGINAQPFITLPAHRFIVGYEDNLYAISKSYMKLQNQKPYETFGLLSSNIGVHDDIIINTGTKDINKLGLIDRFNGKKTLNHWSTAECNRINDATDGSGFPPKMVRNKSPVHFFLKEMCRSLPLHFEKEVKILNGKIPAYRYVLPDDVFDAPDRLPANQCFCNLDLGECPLQGVFNATPCAFGAPVFFSFPHFHNADPQLREGVTGLDTPTADSYRSYVDLHPTLGFVMAGKTRIQVNIQVAKAFGISQVKMFEDGMMLPVAVMETSLEDKTLPEDMVGIIFQTTFTLKSVELGLRYGCLLTAGVTLVAILLMARNWMQVRERSSSIRPLRRNEVV